MHKSYQELLAESQTREAALKALMDRLRDERVLDLADFARRADELRRRVELVAEQHRKIRVKSSFTASLNEHTMWSIPLASQRLSAKSKMEKNELEAFRIINRLTISALWLNGRQRFPRALEIALHLGPKMWKSGQLQFPLSVDPTLQQMQGALPSRVEVQVVSCSTGQNPELSIELGGKGQEQAILYSHLLQRQAMMTISQRGGDCMGTVSLWLSSFLHYGPGEETWSEHHPIISPYLKSQIGTIRLDFVNRRVGPREHSPIKSHAKIKKSLRLDLEGYLEEADRRRLLRIVNFKRSHDIKQQNQPLNLSGIKQFRQRSEKGRKALSCATRISLVLYPYRPTRIAVLFYAQSANEFSCVVPTPPNSRCTVKVISQKLMKLRKDQCKQIWLQLGTSAQSPFSFRQDVSMMVADSQGAFIARYEYNLVVKPAYFDIERVFYVDSKSEAGLAVQLGVSDQSRGVACRAGKGCVASVERGILTVRVDAVNQDSSLTIEVFDDFKNESLNSLVKLHLVPYRTKIIPLKFGEETSLRLQLPFCLKAGYRVQSQEPELVWADRQQHFGKAPLSRVSLRAKSFFRGERAVMVRVRGEQVQRWVLILQTDSPTPLAEIAVSLQLNERKSIQYKFSNRLRQFREVLVKSSNRELVQPHPDRLPVQGNGRADVQFLVKGGLLQNEECWVQFSDCSLTELLLFNLNLK